MDRQRILANLKRLVEVPSISGTLGENQIIELLREMLLEIEYFREHPDQIQIYPTTNDPHGRCFITAFLPGGLESQETVVLLSHVDVVGVEEFGPLKEFAFLPDEYAARLMDSEQTLEVTAALNSGDFLFGRGVLDMKFGIALHLEVLHQAAKLRDQLPGNLLLLAVPDEEDSSLGMLSALPELLRLKRNGLNFLGAINSEPFFPRFPGDSGSYLYTGTVGKLLLFVYAVGQSTHAGNPFAGLNVNLLLSRIVEKIEFSHQLVDRHDDCWAPPPVCLKMSDLRQEYSVQTPHSAYAYFNLTTLSRSPEEVLAEAKKLIIEACSDTIQLVQHKADRYSDYTGMEVVVPPWEVKVNTLSEFLADYSCLTGRDFDEIHEEVNREVGSSDLREATREYFSILHNHSGMSQPLVLIGFAPPYYPHSSLGETPADERVRRVVNRLLERARTMHGDEIEHQRFFPGLSDMSYLRISGSPRSKEVEENTPLWGERYQVPLKEIAELDLPFINIGPRGNDVHKPTERLQLSYSLQVTADLVCFAVLDLLGAGELIEKRP